jgi:hypothetical protein
MNTLDKVLGNALNSTYEQQEMLIKNLQNRHRENRRTEIAADAKKTLADFRVSKFRQQSAEELIAALRQSFTRIKFLFSLSLSIVTSPNPVSAQVSDRMSSI